MVLKKQWDPEKWKAQSLCASCGGNHNRSACKFKNVECWHCGRKGHMAKVCRTGQLTTPNPNRPLAWESQPQGKQGPRGGECFTIYQDMPEVNLR